jgi:NAD(P)-dependent dehydrogenase (short-subunit alcohol dehydrogenase family)
VFDAGFAPSAIGYYIASNAALEVTCQALAVEAAPWNVKVTNFQPGPVMTELERIWSAPPFRKLIRRPPRGPA